ncbi:MAG: transglutaminase-like domain-containing protein [Anaerolineales bacterium]|nr:transglutaminase-like domain-containing protein [Anaerolineales bacterium]
MTTMRQVGFMRRLVERFGGFEMLQLSLLGITLGCVGLGLSVVVTRLSSGFMLLLAIISVWMAWLMSRSRLPNWSYALLGSLGGALGLILTVGGVGRPLLSLLINLPIQWIQNKPLDPAHWQAVEASYSTLIARFINWLDSVNTQTLVIDPTIISIVWGLALWLAVFWSVWWVRRRTSVLPGLLPALVLLGFNVYYTKSEIGIFWLTLTAGSALALQACANYSKSRRRWALHHLAEAEIEPELIISVFLIACGMMLAGFFLPSIPVRQIADAIEKAFEQSSDWDLAKSLGLEQTPVPIQLNATTGLALTENHSIGPGPALDQDIVMFVNVDGFNPPPMNEYVAIIAQNTERFYWRAQIFSEYNGKTWLANTSHVDELPANQSYLSDVSVSDDKFVTQHVIRIQTDEQYVFGFGELLSLDQTSTVAWNETGDIASVLTSVNSYSAVSQVHKPSVEELRAAGEEYPRSLRPYLELPNDLPPRVLDLALNLTADLPTPYDRAVMLEAYLRQFPYSREVPAPPSNRDAVDYFLFDLKTGYCDYYASALVVMARATGIPARLVMGYSEGVYDHENEYFIVRSSNAHAWAELYFPNIGWVEFEPTPNQPLRFRPGQSTDHLQILDLPPPGQEVPLSIDLERTWMGRAILRLLVVAALLFILLLLPLETWWLSSLPVTQVLGNIFQRLYRYGRFLGIPSDPSRTPSEFAGLLSNAIESSVKDEKRMEHIKTLRTDLSYLTGLYNLQLFSERLLLEEEKQNVLEVWKQFRRNLKQVRFLSASKRKPVRIPFWS